MTNHCRRAAILLAVLAAACSQRDTATAPTRKPSAVSASAARSAAITANPHFGFLPPLGADPSAKQPLDESVVGDLRVTVCPSSSPGCGTTAGAVRIEGNHFSADWKTRDLAPGGYDVVVSAFGAEVGRSTVTLAGNEQTIPVKFWLANGGARFTTQIGSAGATIAGEDGTPLAGVRLVIPPLAFGQTTTIILQPADAAQARADLASTPWQGVPVGPAVSITAGAQPVAPLQLSLPFDPGLLPPDRSPFEVVVSSKSGASPYQMEYGSDLAEVPETVVNVLANTVTIPITHFTTFVAGVAPRVLPDAPGDLGCSDETSVPAHLVDDAANVGYGNPGHKQFPVPARASGDQITAIVVHSTSNTSSSVTLEGDIRYGYGSRQAHYYVGRTPERAFLAPNATLNIGDGLTMRFHLRTRVYRFIPDAFVANHVLSDATNHSTIGIELLQAAEGNPAQSLDFPPFTPAQYETLWELIARLRRDHPTIAATPLHMDIQSNKSDAVQFDRSQLSALPDCANAAAHTTSATGVHWESSNPSVATVEHLTGIVTAVASGTATITASVDGVSASATITVRPRPSFDGTYSHVWQLGAFTHTDEIHVSGNQISGHHQFTNGLIVGTWDWSGTITPTGATTASISGSGTRNDSCCGSISFVLTSGNLVLNPDGSADAFYGANDPRFGGFGDGDHRNATTRPFEGIWHAVVAGTPAYAANGSYDANGMLTMMFVTPTTNHTATNTFLYVGTVANGVFTGALANNPGNVMTLTLAPGGNSFAGTSSVTSGGRVFTFDYSGTR